MKVLELGCGDAPTLKDGWEHLDLRDLPHIKYVQSAVDLSNFDDDSFNMIVTKDMIEHLSWREVPKALSEWLRVAPIVEIETPNAIEVLNLLHSDYEPRWNKESDWQRFSRVLFGHQDYPENTHKCYFTVGWLEELLHEAGASFVKIITENPRSFRLRAYR